MHRKRSLTTMLITGALFTSIIGAGCGNGPKYGAARKHKKGCDCPHWNAAPKQEGSGTWSMKDPARNANDASNN